MGFRVHKTIVMVGMMGAGKTAVGRAVADRLGVPFLDSDTEIVQAAQMSIPEIFARDGEPFFRAREREVIARLLTTERGVLSTGGGAFLASENRNLITKFGISVWLNADLELLWARVKGKNTRPLLRTDDPFATLSALFADRVPLYAQADVAVQAKAKYSIEDMAEQVIEALRARADVLEEIG